MADQLKLCCVVFDELAIKENVSYNTEHDEVDDFGDVGKFNILPILFTLKGLACKWKQPIGYFVTSSTPSGDLLKYFLLKCIEIINKYMHVALLSKL